MYDEMQSKCISKIVTIEFEVGLGCCDKYQYFSNIDISMLDFSNY
jgi:hypothetical protein